MAFRDDGLVADVVRITRQRRAVGQRETERFQGMGSLGAAHEKIFTGLATVSPMVGAWGGNRRQVVISSRELVRSVM